MISRIAFVLPPLALCLLSACGRSIEGAPCPCVEGYECCPVQSACHPAGACPVDASSSSLVLPEFCSTDGWCGARVPYGDVTGTSADDIWISAYGISENGARSALLHWDGTMWSTQHLSQIDAAFAQTDVGALFSVGPNDLWVGMLSGTLLHWDGAAWSEHVGKTSFALEGGYTATLVPQIHGLSGSSANDVWAVGSQGGVLHWDGTAWTGVPTTITRDLRAVWARSANDVWVAGDGGSLAHFDGERFTYHDDASGGAVTSVDLAALWGASANDVWAVGADATVLHWDGERWQSFGHSIPSRVDLNALWGSAADDVWAAGADGKLHHYDGVAWREAPGRSDRALRGVWGSGDDTLWAVGDGGSALARDRGTWVSKKPPVVTSDLYAIFGANAEDAWAFGADGWGAHFNGSTWTSVSGAPTVDEATRLWVTAPDEMWAVSGYSILRSDGTNWSLSRTAPTTLRDIWASGPNDAWAVGETFEPVDGTGGGPRGTLLHWDGSAWTLWAEVVVPKAITSVWGSAANNVWFTTESSTVLHWDGAVFTPIELAAQLATPENASWDLVSGSAANDVWFFGGYSWSGYKAGGFARVARHWDGSGWSDPVGFGWSGAGFSSVWHAGPTNLVGVQAAGGGLYHFSGATPARQATGPAGAIYGIWGSERELWAVGQSGVMLRKPLE